MRDHPRMRGEDQPGGDAATPEQGSPPHARGRLAAQLFQAEGYGITPACAGKTAFTPSSPFSTTDHPRMRGEDLHNVVRENVSVGSPPHARGRLPTGRAVRVAERITPACAGKTGIYDLPQLPVADHPRMRGEDKLRLSVGAERGGSPPHARGRRTRMR